MSKGKAPARRARRSYVRYSQEIAGRICERIATGANLFQLSKEPEMPAHPTLYDWIDRYPDFADMVARAEEMRAEFRAERALEIAEAAPEGISGDRLRVSTLIWHASKGNPGRYGAAAGKPAKRGGEDEPPKRNIVVLVRDFRPAVLPDGRTITREFLPDGSQRDHD